MKLLRISPGERQRHGAFRKMMQADVVISGGVIIKNREGKTGQRVDWAAHVWEEEISESSG